jgi:hypothetical protein
MIDTIVVLPATPLFLAEYRGRVDPIEDISAAAQSALQRLRRPCRIVVVTTADVGRDRRRTPLGARVFYELWGSSPVAGVSAVEEVVVASDAMSEACRDVADRLWVEAGDATGVPTCVVLMADGTAARSKSAPGYFDARAVTVDQSLVSAIREARGGPLLALDEELCTELLMRGRAALMVMGGLLARQGWECELLLEFDPFGVQYVVAVIRRSDIAG